MKLTHLDIKSSNNQAKYGYKTKSEFYNPRKFKTNFISNKNKDIGVGNLCWKLYTVNILF